MRKFAIALLALVIVGACTAALQRRFPAAPRPTPIAATAASTAPPSPTSPPAPTPPPTVAFRSGGLGLALADWRARYGPGDIQPTGYIRYADTWELLPLGDYATYIERLYAAPVTLPYAQGNSRPLLPADAALIKTYSPDGRPETLVELWHSPSLAAYLGDADPWEGGAPGEFIVLFKIDSTGAVDRMVITTGNNP